MDSRVPSKIPADMYINFGCSQIDGFRKDTPFSRNIFRYCPNAYRAIRKSMEKQTKPLGGLIASRDRIYRERRDLRQRFFDVYVSHIPVRADAYQYDARKDVIRAAIDSFKRGILSKGPRVRVVVINDIQQYISDADAFEMDLEVERAYREIGQKVSLVLSYGDYAKSDKYFRDEYGFAARI